MKNKNIFKLNSLKESMFAIKRVSCSKGISNLTHYPLRINFIQLKRRLK